MTATRFLLSFPRFHFSHSLGFGVKIFVGFKVGEVREGRGYNVDDFGKKALGGVHLNVLDTAHKRPNDLVLKRLL